MRGLIYCRVSTDEQSKGMSLDYQERINTTFSKNSGISIDKENIFLESYSGAFFDRPKLGKILKIIKEGNIDCIIVLRRDRLARDVYIYNKIINILDEFGVKIFYSEETLSGDSDINDMLGNNLVAFAQFEKSMIFKRTYSGRLQKARNGKWTTQVPYGYIKTREGLLELYKPEVKIIKLIVSLYINDNKKIGEIVGYCNDNKILPPSMSEKETATQLGIQQRRKNASMFWGYSAVHTILKNVDKYYLGEYKAFTTKYKKVGDKSIIVGKRDEKDIIIIPIPKIFNKAVGKKVEDKRIINRNHSTKGSIRQYLLKGKLFCTCCPDLRNFIGYTTSKNNLIGYRCSMGDKRKTSSDRLCHNSISGLKIDGLVIDTLKDFFLNYNKFIADYSINNKTTDNNINIIDSLKFEIHKLEEKEKRALDLCLDGMLDKNKLKKIQDENKTQIEKLKEKINDEYETAYNDYKQGLLNGEVKDYVKNLYDYALNYFEESSYEDLKQVVDLMIDKVIVPKDKNKPIRIILNVFPGEFEFDKYLDNNRESYITREFEKEKTQLSNYQVEFPPINELGDIQDSGDFAFIKFLKKKFQVLFNNGGPTGLRSRDLSLKRRVLYQLSYGSIKFVNLVYR